jgi:hypothetical protein
MQSRKQSIKLQLVVFCVWELNIIFYNLRKLWSAGKEIVISF